MGDLQLLDRGHIASLASSRRAWLGNRQSPYRLFGRPIGHGGHGPLFLLTHLR